jgi:hypothetical protein
MWRAANDHRRLITSMSAVIKSIVADKSSDMVALTRVKKWDENAAARVAVLKSNVTYVVAGDQSTFIHFIGGTSLEVSESLGDVMEALG